MEGKKSLAIPLRLNASVRTTYAAWDGYVLENTLFMVYSGGQNY